MALLVFQFAACVVVLLMGHGVSPLISGFKQALFCAVVRQVDSFIGTYSVIIMVLNCVQGPVWWPCCAGPLSLSVVGPLWPRHCSTLTTDSVSDVSNDDTQLLALNWRVCMC